MVQAFLFAGARTVAASLRAVDDASTELRMKQFYTHLAQKEDEASALRQEGKLCGWESSPLAPSEKDRRVWQGAGSKPWVMSLRCRSAALPINPSDLKAGQSVASVRLSRVWRNPSDQKIVRDDPSIARGQGSDWEQHGEPNMVGGEKVVRQPEKG